ncbi:MAG: alpha/beta hydrolase [Parachlamydiaceae bacterium]|nr:alpha/beta hydrolase [Parachlamydiaceae bacterium]
MLDIQNQAFLKGTAMLKWTKRIGLSLICLMAVLLLSGAAYQFISTKIDESAYPHPGKLVDVGGYRLHINCSGEGRATTVFDAGMGGSSLEWALVQPEVSKFARACSYDRAGNGWSDESPLERTSENIVDELHTLLKNAKVPGPYILVGHSFGGSNVLLYANRYPDEVAGIVLVDSAHEDYLDKMPAMPEQNESMALLLTYVGGTRLMYAHLPIYKKQLEAFSDEIKEVYLAKLSTNNFIKTVFKQTAMLDKSLKQLKATGAKLGDKPLIVITAGKKMNAEEVGLSEEQVDQIAKVWNDLQKDLVTKSINGKQIFAEHSGHMITREQPAIIVEAIREVIRKVEMDSFRSDEATLFPPTLSMQILKLEETIIYKKSGQL